MAGEEVCVPRVVVEALASVRRATGTEPRDSAALCPVTMTTSALSDWLRPMVRFAPSRPRLDGVYVEPKMWNETARQKTERGMDRNKAVDEKSKSGGHATYSKKIGIK